MKNKLNIETTSKHFNTPVNPVLKEIQERCYENLMDICRGIASSLNVNTNAVMTIQVSDYTSHNFCIVIKYIVYVLLKKRNK